MTEIEGLQKGLEKADDDREAAWEHYIRHPSDCSETDYLEALWKWQDMKGKYAAALLGHNCLES